MFNEEEQNVNKQERSNSLLSVDKSEHDVNIYRRFTLFIICLVGSIVFSFIGVLFAYSLPSDRKECAAALISYALLFVALVAYSNKDILLSLPSLKKWKPYVYGIIGGVLLLTLSNGLSVIINLFHEVETSGNQESLNKTIALYPVASFFMFGIIGPFCEELGYRTGLFGGLKKINKTAAYIVASIIFGVIHLSVSGDIINELLNLPVYIFSGFLLVFIYDKCGFISSYIAHALNNCVILIFILTGAQ